MGATPCPGGGIFIHKSTGTALAVLALVLAAVPTIADGHEDPTQSCQERGYPYAHVFPSTGAAAFSIDLSAFGPFGGGSGGPHLAGPGVGLDTFERDYEAAVKFDEGPGLTAICLTDPLDLDGDRKADVIQTEMLSMQLVGVDPLVGEVSVALSNAARSLGAIEVHGNDPVTGQPVLGNSSFDVFFDITVEGTAVSPPGVFPLHGTNCLDPNQPHTPFCVPFRVEANLFDVLLPPIRDVLYYHPLGMDVPIWVDPDPNDPDDEFIAGKVLAGCHKPNDAIDPDRYVPCLLIGGDISFDGFSDVCYENNVGLYLIDVSPASPRVAGVTTTETRGPLVVTPWTRVDDDSFAAKAVTTSERCTDVGTSVMASYDDGTLSSVLSGDWRQHA